MRPEAILESALYVTDLGAAKSFYAGVLGLDQISEVEGRHVFFRCGSGVLLLFDAAGDPPPAGHRTRRSRCHRTGRPARATSASPQAAEEIARWKAALEASGVAIEADFRWPSGGRSIYFRDPSGNSLEFAEPKIWPLADER